MTYPFMGDSGCPHDFGICVNTWIVGVHQTVDLQPACCDIDWLETVHVSVWARLPVRRLIRTYTVFG